VHLGFKNTISQFQPGSTIRNSNKQFSTQTASQNPVNEKFKLDSKVEPEGCRKTYPWQSERVKKLDQNTDAT
jgi:hypothetical protein